MVDLQKLYEKAWRPLYLIPLLLFSGAVAFFDRLGYQMFQQVENNGDVYSQVVTPYMQLFHGLVFLGVAGMSAVVYYYSSFRDAAAFLVFTLSVVYSGLWDLVYYQFAATPSMPDTLAHLSGTPVGTAAALFNEGVVTPEMVALNAVLFLGVGLPVAGFLRYGDIPFVN